MAKDKFEALLGDDSQEVIDNAASKIDNLKDEKLPSGKLQYRFASKEQHKAVKDYADENGTSVNAIITKALIDAGFKK